MKQNLVIDSKYYLNLKYQKKKKGSNNMTTKSMINFTQLTDLCKHFKMDIDQIKAKSYAELEKMVQTMNHDKQLLDIENRTKDANFIRCVLMYDDILYLLLRYWSYDDAMNAIAKYTTLHDLTKEIAIPIDDKSHTFYETHFQKIDTRMASIPQFDNKGRQLMESKYCKCYIYELPASYRYLSNAKPLEELLKKTFPQLNELESNIYGLHNLPSDMTERTKTLDQFILYAHLENKTTWNVPLKALMTHNSQSIIDATMDYAKSYNSGYYTPENIAQKINEPASQHFFEIVDNLQHIDVKSDEDVDELIEYKKRNLLQAHDL